MARCLGLNLSPLGGIGQSRGSSVSPVTSGFGEAKLAELQRDTRRKTPAPRLRAEVFLRRWAVRRGRGRGCSMTVVATDDCHGYR